MESVLLGVGGALGASCRYTVGLALQRSSFPWGTMIVNVLGSALLGWVVFGAAGRDSTVLVGTGFCGAFTTFSSFSVKTVTLWERGERVRALLNATGTLLVSLLGFGTAWVIFN